MARQTHAWRADAHTERRPIYQLKITLIDSDPPIWRRILVSGNRSLRKLHDILQIAMGWTNSHLHQFDTDGGERMYSDRVFQLDYADDESKVKLRRIAPDEGASFIYEYDFGDCWRHEVVVVKILSPQGVGRTPICKEGERACPPEDIGGVRGYYKFLEALRDKAHEHHVELTEWWGGPFDADELDLDALNQRLRKLA